MCMTACICMDIHRDRKREKTSMHVAIVLNKNFVDNDHFVNVFS